MAELNHVAEAPAAPPSHNSLNLAIEMEFRDARARLAVRDGRFAVNIDGSFHDLCTGLFSLFQPTRILKIAGSVGVVCFALKRLNYIASNFMSGSLRFTLYLDKDEEQTFLENVKSGLFQQMLREEAMEIVKEFSLHHLDTMKIGGISLPGKGNSKGVDRAFNFQKAKINDGMAGISSYREVEVAHGADTQAVKDVLDSSATTSGTETFNFQESEITGGVAGATNVRIIKFESHKDHRKE